LNEKYSGEIKSLKNLNHEEVDVYEYSDSLLLFN
jgi:hypothetical protein